MFKCPIHWAKTASSKFGFFHALSITNANKAEYFVTNGSSIKNLESAFWTNAHHWLMKRAPASDLESLKQKQAAKNG